MKSIKEVELASQAWTRWNDLGVSKRADYLQSFAKALEKSTDFGVMPANMMMHQIKQGTAVIGSEQILPGPTGESNALYTSGRGTFIITGDENSPIVAIVGFVTSAMLAGNCVILCLPESQSSIIQKLLQIFELVLPCNKVLQVASFKAINNLITDESIAGVGLIGGAKQAIKINKQLADRNGLIAQLITETDFNEFSTLTDCYFIYRFITERVRTTNVAAVGGNANLLALGGGDK